jgi:DNA-binding GntR family transcriptional regulator
MADDGIEPFDPDQVTAEYTYVRMANHVVVRIRAGEIPPGARLPGERDLAAEYGVAVGTARRAVRELRDRGWLVTLAAKGTYVRPVGEWPET